MTIPLGVADLLRYLVLALVWTLAGRALLWVAGRKAFSAAGWLLAPAVTQAFVAVTLGMTAVLRTPIRYISPVLWTAVVGLAIVGLAVELIRRANRNIEPVFGGGILVFTVALIVPTIVLLPYFVHGFGVYQGTAHPDAWSYTVFGAYLWDYPPLTDGGLAPVYQWASHLSKTRFVGPAELGWLAKATHEGDTQAAFGLLLALSTFTIGTACAAFGRVLGLRNGLLVLAAVGGGAGNWIGNAVMVSNLDNLLALPFLPALAALASEDTQTARPGKACVAGLLSAALLYTYPEFAAFGLFCSALFFIGPLLALPPRRAAIGIGLCALIVALLVSPYAADLWSYFRTELGTGVSSKPPRPGEGAFSGLIDPALRLPAFWALGTEFGPPLWPTVTYSLAAGLSLLAIVGLIRLVRLRAVAVLISFTLLMSAFSLFVWQYQYSYGAYKFVMLGWWLLTLAVILGVGECSKVHPALFVGAALVASATFAVSAARSIHEVSIPLQPDMRDFRALRAIDLPHGAPIAMAVTDNIPEHWAAYFLRGSQTRLIVYTGYLAAPHVYPAMLRAAPIPWTNLRLLLTDATDGGPIEERQGWSRLWRNRWYALWDTGDVGWAVAGRITNPPPYALEEHRVWVGDAPTRLVVTASAAGVATIHASVDKSEAFPRTLRPARLLTTDGSGAKCAWTISDRDVSLSWQVQPGDNVLTLVRNGPPEADVSVADQQHSSLFALVKPTLEFQRSAPGASFTCRHE